MSAAQPSLTLFGGRRGQRVREALTAYAMIGPAILLIFVFGIFPVGFALYVSLHKWIIVRSDFIGLENYVAAIDNLTYIVIFALGVGGLYMAYRLGRKLAADLGQTRGWLLAVPGLLHAAAVAAFFRWLFYQLPEFLDIATKMRGQERTRDLFVGLLTDAFRAESVAPHWQSFMMALVAALAVGALALAVVRVPENANLQARLAWAWLAAGAGVGLLVTAYRAVGAAYAAAFEASTDPGIWPQLIVIVSGVLLLWLAWRLWRSAEGQVSGRSFALRLLGALALMVGAVLLITEAPTVLASGDEDMWNGLRVTVFFSLGTVPVQLGVALVLAVLLFQRLRGSNVFRVLYFLPYVTPAVASATIFRLLFSDRETAPVNRILETFGIGRQLWLREPEGVVSILAGAVGIENFPQAYLGWLPPDLGALAAGWLTGPSLALVVILTLSVWTFVGYNTVIYLAGLGNIPQELVEAAEIDGANKWAVFRHVTFPLLSPTTYFLSLVGVMGTFKSFNTIWVMRSGQALGTTDTFSIVIFQEFFEKSRYGYASALAFVLFGIILLLTYANSKIQGSRVFYG